MDQTQSAALTRLLSHLDHALLSGSPDPRLSHSQYERNRIGVNIEHARTLLLTLEKQSATIRIQTHRQQIHTDLQKKRELVKALGKRLEELNSLGDDADTDSDSDSDEDDDEAEGNDAADRTREYAPARQDVEAGLETREPQGARISEPEKSELRARKQQQPLSASDNRSAASTTARETLFSGMQKQHLDSSNTETLMSHNRTEQEALTTGLLGLAKALKQNSVAFGASLEQEKEVLKRAEGGLDNSAKGMAAAERRMGLLRRMSEGQGWWGRIKLYAFIFALWLAAFAITFIGPKLRF
jgi:hypothetical protein